MEDGSLKKAETQDTVFGGQKKRVARAFSISKSLFGSLRKLFSVLRHLDSLSQRLIYTGKGSWEEASKAQNKKNENRKDSCNF